VVAISLAVVVIVVINGFRLVATTPFVRAEYRLRALPPDVGLSLADRRSLALVGLESIRPRSRGGELLERTTLPDGASAFNERELAHMHDVRVVFRRALRLQTLLAALLAVAAIGLRRTRYRTLVPAGLLLGGLATLVGALALVPFVLLGFDGVFVRFHELFFDGDSWRFAADDTLLRIYPERFWEDTSVVIAALVVVQALVAAIAGRYWLRRVSRS
jgi:integral membrane protein (TIGR01906 family)